jgi:catechol 2,3-dioxygenase-like lactoylglutathione lyase family enzyme
MIGYVTLGTNDLGRAEKFYDELLAELGAKRIVTNERMRFYGSGPGKPMFIVCKPFDGKPASVGNGTMVALTADSKEAVHRIHEKAIALGASDEGAPGPRGNGFYGGYFRDLDGNKIVAFVLGAA